MPYEVEQKFRVADVALLEAQLRALGAKPGEIQTQIDRYFKHPNRDFAHTDEALRLRRQNHQGYVTYKGPKQGQAGKVRREIEFALAAGEASIEQCSQLLAALGFILVREVAKQRYIWRLAWEGQAVCVAIDRVRELGVYIELELMVDEPSPNDPGSKIAELTELQQSLARLSVKLELPPEERRGYLELLLESDDAQR